QLCRKNGILPAQIISDGHIKTLQQKLLQSGHHIPGLVYEDSNDLVRSATLTASSELHLDELPEQGMLKTLDPAVAQLIPLPQGEIPEMIVHADTTKASSLNVALYRSSKPGNFTPDVMLEEISIPLTSGRNCIPLTFKSTLGEAAYVFLVFRKNPDVQLHFSPRRITGLISVFNHINPAVSNYGKQTP